MELQIASSVGQDRKYLCFRASTFDFFLCALSQYISYFLSANKLFRIWLPFEFETVFSGLAYFWYVRVNLEGKTECRAFQRCRFKAHLSTELNNNLIYDCKAESNTILTYFHVLLWTFEQFKYPILILIFDSDSRIFHWYFQIITSLFCIFLLDDFDTYPDLTLFSIFQSIRLESK